ncbi:MAG: imidazolonepropionase [Actinomycetota bacterium]
MSDRAEASGSLVAPLVVPLGGEVPLRRRALLDPPVLRNSEVAWKDGVITHVGPPRKIAKPGHRLERAAIVPGFVDCHTHLPFFGWRADEYVARLEGRTYRDLHGEGGGIGRSARMLADASDEEVLAFCLPLAAEMLAHGTVAIELKTGYGLSVEAELRQARLARRLAEAVEQTCTVTLLACHAVPPGMERAAWVDAACDELIPCAAEEGLADAIDVYVEDLAFTVEDLERVAAAASRAGLPFRCHADQLGPSRAAQAASRLGARSADHLNHIDEDGVAALASSETTAVLLPTSTFTLRAKPPPARELLEAGAAVAVATDFNPGTSPVLSMPEAIAMACTMYGIPPLAALGATTANAAAVLGLSGELGSLAPGKRADFVVLDVDDPSEVPYRPGHNPVRATIVGGRVVAGAMESGGRAISSGR